MVQITKIYLFETTMVLTSFMQTQFSEFNQMLLLEPKCCLFSNENISEFIFICEGCHFFL